MNANIIVSRLPQPEHAGDWHDKPLRWSVDGPREECQKFSTRKDAEAYARIRRRSSDQLDAINAFRAI